MTTVSGSVDFKITRDTLSTAALRLLGAVDPENTAGPTATQLTNAAEALNLLIKQWQYIGLELWVRKYAAIFPQKGQQVYVLGDPTPAGDHACLSTPLGTGFVKTTLSSAMIAGATSAALTAIATTATAGIPAIPVATAWNIGIQQDSGTIFWTTVNGALSGNTATLTAGITTAASAGQAVYAYATKLMRPLRVLDGFYRMNGGNDVPCRILSREEYNRFGMKSSTGTTIQLYYDPGSTGGNLYVYPASSLTNGVLYIEFTKPIDDMDSSTDDFNFPQEWLNALKYGLALAMAPEYEISEMKYKQIQWMAQKHFDEVKSYDQEFASMYIQPSNWSYTDSRGY
jgi:hypothetical protein